METAILAFSAIKLLFCSLALAAADVAAVLEEPGFEPATPPLAATAAATADLVSLRADSNAAAAFDLISRISAAQASLAAVAASFAARDAPNVACSHSNAKWGVG